MKSYQKASLFSELVFDWFFLMRFSGGRVIEQLSELLKV